MLGTGRPQRLAKLEAADKIQQSAGTGLKESTKENRATPAAAAKAVNREKAEPTPLNGNQSRPGVDADKKSAPTPITRPEEAKPALAPPKPEVPAAVHNMAEVKPAKPAVEDPSNCPDPIPPKVCSLLEFSGPLARGIRCLSVPGNVECTYHVFLYLLCAELERRVGHVACRQLAVCRRNGAIPVSSTSPSVFGRPCTIICGNMYTLSLAAAWSLNHGVFMLLCH